MQRPLLALLLPLSLNREENEVSALWCPAERVGNRCPEPSWWSFYKCCGHLHKSCCSHLRLWVLVLIVALPIVLLILPVIYLLRKLFCREEPSRAPSRIEVGKDTSL